MPTIVYREQKGSALTTAELDANLTNINAETVDNSSVFKLRPSLDLDIVGSKTLSPLATFSRGSTGTYYDGKTVAKAEENLLTYSQDFDNAAWSRRIVSVTANSDVAPDGTTSADKITVTTTVSSWGALLYRSFSTTSQINISCYFKYGSGSGWVFIYSDTPTFKQAFFNIITGSVGSVGSGLTNASITSVGNGWYRCSVTTPSASAIGFGLANSDGDAAYASTQGDSVILWGAQLEQRSNVTAYTPTLANPITNYIPVLQTEVANAARFDHDPITGESRGLLIEEQRTNLLTYSEQFDNSAWAKTRASIAANTIVAPDGTITADKLIEDTTSSNTHLIGQSPTYSDATAYTHTIYARAGGRTRFAIRQQSSGSRTAVFDLSAGSVVDLGIGTTASIQSVGNGWYRCQMTATTIGTGTTLFAVLLVDSGTNTIYTGDGYSGIYIWGAQLEQGSSATSYIPTPLIYAGRASTATYKGDDGYLKTAAINEARYERNALGGRQLLLEGAASNIITNTTSLKLYSSQHICNLNSTLSPDGTYSATEIVNLVTGSALARNFTATSSSVTYSLYVKKGTGYSSSGNIFGFYNTTTGLDVGFVTVNLNTGSFSIDRAVAVSVVSVGNDWWRIAVTNTSGINSGNLVNIYFGYVGSGSVVGTRTYVWGAQVESGSVATSYMPSIETFTSRASIATYFNSSGVLSTAAINTARTSYAYDSARNRWISQGLILETTSTNLHPKSSAANIFDASGSEVTMGQADIAGTSLAVKHDGTIRTISGYVICSGLTANSIYTYSAYIKNINATSVGFYVDGGATATTITPLFSTSGTSVIGTPTTDSVIKSASIQNCGNGWYRISITVLTDADGGNFNPRFQTIGGSAYYCFPQLESGNQATSYIPTTTARVTRAADVYASVAGSRAADIYSSSAVTRQADQLSISKTAPSWFNSVSGTLSLAHDAAAGQPLLGDGSTTMVTSLGAGTTNIDYSNSQLSVVSQSGQSNYTQGIFNFDSDLQILGNSTTKANAHVKYLKFYPNNVLNSTPDGYGFVLDDGFALLQEDGSVLFQE